MSETERKPWEDLLAGGETQKVSIKSPKGATFDFELKMPTFPQLEEAKSDCYLMDSQTGEVTKTLHGRWARNKLLLCVVKSPFPPETQKQNLLNLHPQVGKQLNEEINKMLATQEEIPKK